MILNSMLQVRLFESFLLIITIEDMEFLNLEFKSKMIKINLY